MANGAQLGHGRPLRLTRETSTVSKYIYDFSEGSRDMRDLLGGKGANVAGMTRVLGAYRVPAGFTITTEACVAYLRNGQAPPAEMTAQVDEALGRLEVLVGKRLGDGDDPLLVSVRSGARESMPGMMDTVLNLGLSDRAVRGLATRTGNERFAWDLRQAGFDGGFETRVSVLEQGAPGYATTEEVSR
jgi:pyruvate,orthophosphate dikinase